MNDRTKPRHGCLTAWLILNILFIIRDLAAALVPLVSDLIMKQAYPAALGWWFPFWLVIDVFALICLISLFRWKKWGFWGFCASTVVYLVVYLSTFTREGITREGIVASLAALISIAFLYGVLQIGKENKGWPQLE